MPRYTQSLNGLWRFKTDKKRKGIAEGWERPDFDRNDWDTATVPGVWQDYKRKSYEGHGWYALTFEASPPPNSKLAVVFDALDDLSDVWLNGKRIGSHVGFGRRIHFDITTILAPGSNTLAIRIKELGGPNGMIGSTALCSYEDETELLASPYHRQPVVQSADWVRDAVIYEIYLRSFSPEGTFKALEARLPELKALGVTVLWLMPIHPTGALHRKGSLGSPYAVQDYYAVNPEFGTIEDFTSLVAAAHKRGMNLILDLVVNHTAWDNPLMTEHPDWYTRNAEGRVISPVPNWIDVADLDYPHRELCRWMIDMMKYWVSEASIDGYRCDVADFIPVEFWREARKELDAIKPVMMLAEGATPELHVGAFDITYAWNTYDILPPIGKGEDPAGVLETVLRNERYYYPEDALRMRFSTNHDKHKYDMSDLARYGVEGAKAAAVLMYTLPGTPMIYNGQEVGNTKRLSLFEKVPIDWENDPHGFRQFYTALNAIRKEHSVFARGSFAILPVFDNTGVFAFTRRLSNQKALVIVNLSDSAANGSVPLDEVPSFAPLFTKGTAQTQKGSLAYALPPSGYWIGTAED